MGVAVGEQSAGTAPPRQTGDPVPSRPHTDEREQAAERDPRLGGPMRLPRVIAHPLTQTRYDQELHAMVRHVYGYSWTCSEHGGGPRCDTMREAVLGKREHEQEHR